MADDRETANVIRLFGGLMRLPLDAFMYGMQILVRTIQGLQSMAEQGIDTIARDGPAQRWPDVPSMPGLPSDATVPGTSDERPGATAESDRKERCGMPDQDLSGENTLKLVRYKVVFVKRDYEVAFREQEELVAYGTTAAEWAGLKVARFMRDLSTTERPSLWTGRESPYPPGANNTYINEIPEEDQKYIKVYFEVLQRWDREDAEYDRQQVRVLREIRDEIGGVRAGIGGSASR